MNILYDRFAHLRQQKKVSWELLEQDYVLSWMLSGIAHTQELKEMLAFKGGTALKKIYFGDYRFSQDLDFTVKNLDIDFAAIDRLMEKATIKSMELQAAHGYPIKMAIERYQQKLPHPRNQRAFTIMAQLLWHKRLYTRVMVDITVQESLILCTHEKNIIHSDFQEELSGSLHVYQLEEIIAEKIRAILEYSRKIHERGWGRSRVRDYYDIWQVLTKYRDHLHLSQIPQLVAQKCAIKNILFSSPTDLFLPTLLAEVENEWHTWLHPLVGDLPPAQSIINGLKSELEIIWNLPITRKNSAGQASEKS